MHLAEFNIGILRYEWDDPRVADFADNLDRVYAIAERSPGYIWHMGGDDMSAAQLDPNGILGGAIRKPHRRCPFGGTLPAWNISFGTRFINSSMIVGPNGITRPGRGSAL